MSGSLDFENFITYDDSFQKYSDIFENTDCNQNCSDNSIICNTIRQLASNKPFINLDNVGATKQDLNEPFLVRGAFEHDPKFGNFNFYNKCVFLINKNVTNESEIKESPKDPTEEEDENPPPPSKKIARHNLVLENNEKIPVAELLSHIKVSQCQENCNNVDPEEPEIVQPKETRKIVREYSDLQLYFFHNGTMKPILSNNIKPGVFKKVVPTDAAGNSVCNKPVSPRKLKNVFISPTEASGRILDKDTFYEMYLIEKTSRVTPAEIPEPPIDAAMETIQFEPQSEEIYSPPIDIPDNCFQFGDLPDSICTEDEFCLVRPEEINLLPVNNFFVNSPLHNPELVTNITQPPVVDTQPVIPPPVVEPEKKKPAPTRGRPKKGTGKKALQKDQKPAEDASPPPPTATTKFGRISKPPNHMQDVFVIDTITAKASAEAATETPNDRDFYYSKDITSPASISTSTPKAKRERFIPPQYRCNYCKKVYLGKSKMLKHMDMYPDHFIDSTLNHALRDNTLYKLLAKKIELLDGTDEDRAKLFLDEITDLVDQLQSRSSRLIRNNSNVHFISSRIARVLGIPEGHFGLNIGAINSIDQLPLPPRPTEEPSLGAPPPPRLDYNLSISLDDTIVDAKLNLSENMVPSDDSLLRTVDDLVKERMKHLDADDDLLNSIPASSSSVINYDHASDNAVEASTIKHQPTPILDLSLDLFQFNSN